MLSCAHIPELALPEERLHRMGKEAAKSPRKLSPQHCLVPGTLGMGEQAPLWGGSLLAGTKAVTAEWHRAAAAKARWHPIPRGLGRDWTVQPHGSQPKSPGYMGRADKAGGREPPETTECCWAPLNGFGAVWWPSTALSPARETRSVSSSLACKDTKEKGK